MRFLLCDVDRYRHARALSERYMAAGRIRCCCDIDWLRGPTHQRSFFVRHTYTGRVLTSFSCKTSPGLQGDLRPYHFVSSPNERMPVDFLRATDRRTSGKVHPTKWQVGTGGKGGLLGRKEKASFRLLGESYVISEALRWLEKTEYITHGEIGPWVRSVHNLFLLAE